MTDPTEMESWHMTQYNMKQEIKQFGEKGMEALMIQHFTESIFFWKKESLYYMTNWLKRYMALYAQHYFSGTILQKPSRIRDFCLMPAIVVLQI
jgi:hypothetical protein